MPEAQQAGFEPCPQVTRVPHVREIEITLFRTIDTTHPEGPQSVRFRLTVDDQFSQPMTHRHGDLVPYLTATQINRLVAFMDEMWAKATAEVTP